jgi:hypothetical protein
MNHSDFVLGEAAEARRALTAARGRLLQRTDAAGRQRTGLPATAVPVGEKSGRSRSARTTTAEKLAT